MTISMTVAKITVSLPDELASRMRQAVHEGRAESVSSFVARALERELDDDDLNKMLADMLDAVGGPVTDAEARWADAQLGGDRAGGAGPPFPGSEP